MSLVMVKMKLSEALNHYGAIAFFPRPPHGFIHAIWAAQGSFLFFLSFLHLKISQMLCAVPV